jgi:hypothetical protein
MTKRSDLEIQQYVAAKETMVKDQVDIVKQARKYLPTVERVPESRRR